MAISIERKFIDTRKTFKKLRPKLIKSALVAHVIVIILIITAFTIDTWVIVTYPPNYTKIGTNVRISDASFGAMSFCYYEESEFDRIKYKHCTSYWTMLSQQQIDADPFTDRTIAEWNQGYPPFDRGTQLAAKTNQRRL
ncbi:hypothetical protein GJ496_011891 [Pomphorhynchus laevis]|nr:hypothetical protein GJ496_011891 [Pomphorhynchus laevis]